VLRRPGWGPNPQAGDSVASVHVIDTTESLASIRAALHPINPEASEFDIDAATDAATDELRHVAYGVAAFANGLDDGIGFFNSSTEFGRQLAAGFDQTRRMSTVSGLLRSLGTDELLYVVGLAMLQLSVASGPSGHPRRLLSDNNREALQELSEIVSSTLLDANMPADPKDEDA
jgi:hypothetical protein